LEVAVVKGEHHRAAVLGIENLAEAVLETPIVLVGTFEEEARRLLRSAREVFLFLFVSSGGGDVGHGRVGWMSEVAASAIVVSDLAIG
jgi:hypothetical protein